MKIAVVGMGYVGLSNAVMLSQNNEVSVLEISNKKVNMLNQGKSPIEDALISKFLTKKSLKISSTTNPYDAFYEASFIIICTPTNFIEHKNSFCTQSIDEVIKNIDEQGFNGLIIIRSTVPIGYTQQIQEKYKDLSIAFIPEFLREGSALQDSLNPSRIICGSSSKLAIDFLELLKSSGLKKDTPILLTGPSEAEAIKLFSNSYLALRLAFFNELDTFAFSKKLETEDLINGICMDPRIGNFYNNPSFGYGGYCLPKDVKQLSANFDGISQAMISATIVSNEQRKKFIANYLKNHPAEKIGIYRLTMKQGSDNIREAALLNVISLLKEKNKQISIYEPYLDSNVFMGINVIHDFNKFIDSNDLIVTNRITPELASIKKEIFSRDIFNVN